MTARAHNNFQNAMSSLDTSLQLFESHQNFLGDKDPSIKLGSTLKKIAIISMVATAAIAITTAALISLTPVSGSIFIACSIFSFLAAKDTHKLGTNYESIGLNPLDNLDCYVSTDKMINKITDGTILKPFWSLILKKKS